MLRLLADSETAIRRSANPRLVVETLLLRWTMLDRIVDLAAGAGGGAGAAPAGAGSGAGARGAAAPAAPPAAAAAAPAGRHRASAGQRPGPAAPRRRPAPAELPSRPPTGLPRAGRAPRGLARHRGRGAGPEPLPGRGAGGTRRRRALELPWLTVEPRGAQPAVRRAAPGAGRERWRRCCAGAIGQPVRLRVTEAGSRAGAPPAPPRQLTEASLKADRLRSFRAKDPPSTRRPMR